MTDDGRHPPHFMTFTILYYGASVYPPLLLLVFLLLFFFLLLLILLLLLLLLLLFFTGIRTKKKIKSNIGLLVNEDGVLTQDSRQMAEILNTNFASVFTIENLDTVPERSAPY